MNVFLAFRLFLTSQTLVWRFVQFLWFMLLISGPCGQSELKSDLWLGSILSRHERIETPCVWKKCCCNADLRHYNTSRCFLSQRNIRRGDQKYQDGDFGESGIPCRSRDTTWDCGRSILSLETLYWFDVRNRIRLELFSSSANLIVDVYHSRGHEARIVASPLINSPDSLPRDNFPPFNPTSISPVRSM